MIVGIGKSVPFVDIDFSFGSQSAYLNASGILDTGCNVTQVPLGVLLSIGLSYETIDIEIERLKYFLSDYIVDVNTSSGVYVPTIYTRISNIVINSGMYVSKFDYLDVRLSLTSKSKFVLLGYDFIMAHRNVMNYNNKLAIDNFDANYYSGLCSNRKMVDINDIMSYMSLSGNIT